MRTIHHFAVQNVTPDVRNTSVHPQVCLFRCLPGFRSPESPNTVTVSGRHDLLFIDIFGRHRAAKLFIVRSLVLVLYETLVASKLDRILQMLRFDVFVPLCVWEGRTPNCTKIAMRMIMAEDLEAVLGSYPRRKVLIW
jgi:hypothetical protein